VRAGVAYASAQLVIGRTIQQELAQAGGTRLSAPSGGVALPTEPALTAVTLTQVEAQIEKTIPMMSYYAVAMTAMFLLFGSMFGAFSFITERRERTLARMLSAPVHRAAIVGGKALGIFGVGVAQFLVLLVGTRLLFRVDWGQNVLGTVMLGVAEVAAAAGLAMTLAALGKTERAVGGIGPALIIFFAATGGSMIPADMLPAWLKPLQVISPVYWAVGGYLDIMAGASVADVLGRAAAILAIGAVLLAFGIWRLRYE
jgi:ABC-2 type transport system permease protein